MPRNKGQNETVTKPADNLELNLFFQAGKEAMFICDRSPNKSIGKVYKKENGKAVAPGEFGDLFKNSKIQFQILKNMVSDDKIYEQYGQYETLNVKWGNEESGTFEKASKSNSCVFVQTGYSSSQTGGAENTEKTEEIKDLPNKTQGKMKPLNASAHNKTTVEDSNVHNDENNAVKNVSANNKSETKENKELEVYTLAILNNKGEEIKSYVNDNKDGWIVVKKGGKYVGYLTEKDNLGKKISHITKSQSGTRYSAVMKEQLGDKFIGGLTYQVEHKSKNKSVTIYVTIDNSNIIYTMAQDENDKSWYILKEGKRINEGKKDSVENALRGRLLSVTSEGRVVSDSIDYISRRGVKYGAIGIDAESDVYFEEELKNAKENIGNSKSISVIPIKVSKYSTDDIYSVTQSTSGGACRVLKGSTPVSEIFDYKLKEIKDIKDLDNLEKEQRSKDKSYGYITKDVVMGTPCYYIDGKNLKYIYIKYSKEAMEKSRWNGDKNENKSNVDGVRKIFDDYKGKFEDLLGKIDVTWTDDYENFGNSNFSALIKSIQGKAENIEEDTFLFPGNFIGASKRYSKDESSLDIQLLGLAWDAFYNKVAEQKGNGNTGSNGIKSEGTPPCKELLLTLMREFKKLEVSAKEKHVKWESDVPNNETKVSKELSLWTNLKNDSIGLFKAVVKLNSKVDMSSKPDPDKYSKRLGDLLKSVETNEGTIGSLFGNMFTIIKDELQLYEQSIAPQDNAKQYVAKQRIIFEPATAKQYVVEQSVPKPATAKQSIAGVKNKGTVGALLEEKNSQKEAKKGATKPIVESQPQLEEAAQNSEENAENPLAKEFKEELEKYRVKFNEINNRYDTFLDNLFTYRDEIKYRGRWESCPDDGGVHYYKYNGGPYPAEVVITFYGQMMNFLKEVIVNGKGLVENNYNSELGNRPDDLSKKVTDLNKKYRETSEKLTEEDISNFKDYSQQLLDILERTERTLERKVQVRLGTFGGEVKDGKFHEGHGESVYIKDFKSDDKLEEAIVKNKLDKYAKKVERENRNILEKLGHKVKRGVIKTLRKVPVIGELPGIKQSDLKKLRDCYKEAAKYVCSCTGTVDGSKLLSKFKPLSSVETYKGWHKCLNGLFVTPPSNVFLSTALAKLFVSFIGLNPESVVSACEGLKLGGIDKNSGEEIIRNADMVRNILKNYCKGKESVDEAKFKETIKNSLLKYIYSDTAKINTFMGKFDNLSKAQDNSNTTLKREGSSFINTEVTEKSFTDDSEEDWSNSESEESGYSTDSTSEYSDDSDDE